MLNNRKGEYLVENFTLFTCFANPFLVKVVYNKIEVLSMSIIGNLIWFIFGGFWQGLAWLGIGVLWCLTIVGIPVGLQCFKLARLACFPFGKEVVHSPTPTSCLLNLLWLIFGGFPIALAAVVNGIAFCITIVGIPFGLQCFKLASLALSPFGARIRDRGMW